MDEAQLAQYDAEVKTFRPGQIVKGVVVQTNPEEVLVDIGYKSEGIIPLHESGIKAGEKLEDVFHPGQEIEVAVIRVESGEGNVILSRRRAIIDRAWNQVVKAYQNDEVIEATVTERVKGGLLVDLGVRGFIPASHVEMNFVNDLSRYVGKKLRLKVVELDRRRNNVVLSRKKVLEDEYAKAKERAFEELRAGQVVEGEVKRLTNFGAFVDIGGGVEGLLHVSEMGWSRVRHPSDVLKEGQKIRVMILGIDRERERISLGLKQTLPDPWEDIGSRYYVGQIVEGVVTRVVDFGAFVKLEDGVEGLVHISQLAEGHVEQASDAVHPRQKVPVKILSIDEEARRISLSIREALREQRGLRGNATTYSTGRQGDGVTIGELTDLGSLLDRAGRREER